MASSAFNELPYRHDFPTTLHAPWLLQHVPWVREFAHAKQIGLRLRHQLTSRSITLEVWECVDGKLTHLYMLSVMRYGAVSPQERYCALPNSIWGGMFAPLLQNLQA